jgi:hypothetical protein
MRPAEYADLAREVVSRTPDAIIAAPDAIARGSNSMATLVEPRTISLVSLNSVVESHTALTRI